MVDSVLKEQRKKAAKPMLWIGMVSMAMVFAGLTSGYIVRRAEGNWILFDLPQDMYISTVAIVLSSVTMIFATRAAKAENRNKMLSGLLGTFILGSIFVYMQFEAFETLINGGIYFTGESSNAAGSFLYVIVIAHLVHVAFGFISLLYMMVNGLRGKYDNGNILGLEIGGQFWHFLDGVWIYLFVFLLLVR
jgi:cytochrome c oxidase subunit 3